jgi:hypothetical protein
MDSAMKTLRVLLLLLLVTFMASVASGKDSLFVQIAGDNLTIWDVHAIENCASRFVSSLALSHDTLTWVQTDTVGPIARCICTYDLAVSMRGLPSGTYRACLFRDRKKMYHYSKDTLEFIGSIPFSISSSAQVFGASAFYQSECLGTAIVQENILPVPGQIALGNYPNPFNPKTVISCQWPVASTVRLVVFDMIGREVVTLMDGQMPAGIFNLPFDGSGLSSGVYFCRLHVEPVREVKSAPGPLLNGTKVLTTRMMLMR